MSGFSPCEQNGTAKLKKDLNRFSTFICVLTQEHCTDKNAFVSAFLFLSLTCI